MLDSTGAIVRSADLLTLGPLIVSFYRGQWGPFCNLELNALKLALPEIEELGGALVPVSPEAPEHTEKALTRAGAYICRGQQRSWKAIEG
jgi:peroxiredoxin